MIRIQDALKTYGSGSLLVRLSLNKNTYVTYNEFLVRTFSVPFLGNIRKIVEHLGMSERCGGRGGSHPIFTAGICKYFIFLDTGTFI